MAAVTASAMSFSMPRTAQEVHFQDHCAQALVTRAACSRLRPEKAQGKWYAGAGLPSAAIALSSTAAGLLGSQRRRHRMAGMLKASRALRPTRSRLGCRDSALTLRASGKIETFMVKGPVNAGNLAMAIAPLAAHIDLSCLVFFSLGVPPETIASVAGGSLGIHGMCPVYIADCYGIIGWDKKEGQNVELMELNRGSEYGHAGGQGGEGVVVAAFRGKCHSAGGSGSLHMVVKPHGKSTLEAADGGAGLSYGGYAKDCYKLEHSGDLVPVDEIVVTSDVPAAVSCFDGDNAAEVASSTSSALTTPVSAVGYFPCFCRGFNKYGKDGAEPNDFASSLGSVPLFGMFAHGELGPAKGSPAVAAQESEVQHEMHSATSVLALYGS